MKKIYPFGYNAAAVGMMKVRTAEANAGFLLDRLSPGASLLDVGCGPGSITVGIAKALSPGMVVGVDIEASQVELGRQHAEEEKVENCRFETASVLDLPMDDQCFDAIYGHTILMQFDDLVARAGRGQKGSEIRRPGRLQGDRYRGEPVSPGRLGDEGGALRFETIGLPQ